MTYYYKLITKQDITRSFVINKKALKYFFNSQLTGHGHEDTIMLKYKFEDFIPTKIVLHQDPRILIKDRSFKIGEIAYFQKVDEDHFILKIIDNPELISKIVYLMNKNKFYLSNINIL